MTGRLGEICSLIDYTDSFIDVGCDHGYVVKYVSDNALAGRITACDISKPSLFKAERLLRGYSGIDFVCADGASVAAGHSTVLISGMGGLEITNIILCCRPQTFIVSPQSHVREVRLTLLERDYNIVYDRVISDGKKYYDVIKAAYGGGKDRLRDIKELELKFGMFLGVKNDALLRRLESMLKAVKTYPATEENKTKEQEIKEAIKCQLR